MTQPAQDDQNVQLTDSSPLTFTGPNGLQYSAYMDGTFTDMNGNQIPFEQGTQMLQNADLDS